MKSSAIANSNIALVKYWGKQDKELILPYNNSISLTISDLHTHTTVEFNEELKEDQITLNDSQIDETSRKQIIKFLDIIRKDSDLKAKIVSKNNFPTASGLASSASGYAALTLAATKALNLNLTKEELSKLARRGSGSACRSIYGGLSEWQKGTNNDDSFAKQIEKKDYWPDLRMLICTTTTEEKKTKSRAGMAQTVATSPMYKSWLDTIENDLTNVRTAIKNKDFTLLGKTAESNCLKMHATMITTEPPIIYWNPTTIKIMKQVELLREQGIECYYTMDAGPQVKILCLKNNQETILEKIKQIDGVINTITTKPGEPAKTTEQHLF
ncbi:diphosphomevalonate decarboxylase [Candidatus Woesearchaeota archaeon]|jgi:diphosphomevalonate decarboxylase|nr:diphosphomevalonate decarboxylase [Candidatus Woesearchaeota archaeon]MBT3537208.1 diphosphomevalonate decarboxylase [Candidatus Woesearchaeota archaeon]MBT4698195.1 diphosphomevalonate decarboxylase [Candidatus Woesearchaeota archaeon]MBT4716500.1 diphosphomevalonate decarboxylase [Candidatus Woesearchaeota archaeon]MBT7106482.1 diphosphomevalonate decarboxylase [Candidatus Woesearchaeota archaeon]